MNLLDNLQQLRKKLAGGDESIVNQLNLWEQEIKKQTNLTELSKNEILKDVLKNLRQFVEDINISLVEDESMSQEKRNELFIQRTCWLWLINLFTDSKKVLKEIEDNIKDNLYD